MLLEICANSYQSAINAQQAGAHRIELCQELEVGGLTPSYGTIKKVIDDVEIPVFVLIRPRSGDFIYSEAEFDIMKKDIEICKDLGVQGIVSGVLNPDASIDVERTKALVQGSRPLVFTFHRAFDEVKDPLVALENLIELGVDRVLTSGQKQTAEEGIDVIKQLHEKSNGRLTILAGAGIHASNASQFKAIGLKEIHASASVNLCAGSSKFNAGRTISDRRTIEAILKQIS